MRIKIVSILIIVLIPNSFTGFNAHGGGPRVTVYQHCGYKGYRVSLSVGSYTTSQLRRLGVRNDDLSSIRVPRGLKVTLYRHDNFEGRSWRLYQDCPCFDKYCGVCNDCVSSIIVQYQ